MTQNARTFHAKINVSQGENEHTHHWLVVADNENEAHMVAYKGCLAEADDADDEDEDEPSLMDVMTSDSGVYSHGGELHWKVQGLYEIGLATFLEMSKTMHVRIQENRKLPSHEDLATLKDVAAAVQKSLAAGGTDIPRVTLLEAFASATGSRNWGQYKANLVPVPLLEMVVRQAQSVSDYSSTEGCNDGYTVTYQPAIDALQKACSQVQAIINNAKA